MLNRAGFRAGASRSLVLSLDIEGLGNATSGDEPGWAVYAELFDRERGTTLLSRDMVLLSSSRRDAAALARELADAVFSRHEQVPWIGRPGPYRKFKKLI
jgi:hypothetical protein